MNKDDKSPVRTWRMASYEPTDAIKKRVREPIAPPTDVETIRERRDSSALRRL